MIKNRNQKLNQVLRRLQHDIERINAEYRRGPSLYFYQRICRLRSERPRVDRFLANERSCEMLYAGLVAWDMNARRAKMKDFRDFTASLRAVLPHFRAIEAAARTFDFTPERRKDVVETLAAAYENLRLMESGGRLVSNSKCLHFLFPELCLPMDRRNTLMRLYGNTGESPHKFREVLEFACDALAAAGDLTAQRDDQWNYTPMKMVDNAILLWSAKWGTQKG